MFDTIRTNKSVVGTGIFVMSVLLLIGAGCADQYSLENMNPDNQQATTTVEVSTSTQDGQEQNEDTMNEQANTSTNNMEERETEEGEEEATPEEVVSKFREQIEAVQGLVAEFDTRMEENPDMVTDEQQELWEESLDEMEAAHDQAVELINELEEVDTSEFASMRVETKEAIQAYAKAYLEGKQAVFDAGQEQQN